MKYFLFTLLTLAGVIGISREAFAIGACTGTNNPMRVITRDANGTLQAGINVQVYQELTDPDGNPYYGSSALASGKTDAGGQSDIFCLNPTKAPYAVKVYESSATYGYFTIWSSQQTTDPGSGLITAQVRMSSLYVLLRDAEGTVIKSAKFDLYVQSFDVNNQPIIDETKLNQDKLITSSLNTGDFGAKVAYLSAGNYVVRVYATGGKTYFHFWNQRVETEKITTLDTKLSTLRAVLEDGYSDVIKNQKLSIYTQKFDVRNKPIVGDLVAADLSTGSTGKVDAYVPAGTYALKINGSYSNAFYYKWRVAVTDQELTTATYRLSGFRIIIRDDKGNLVRSAKFSIATQKTDALGNPVVETIVLRDQNTGEAGYLDVYVPPDTYVLIYGTKRLYQLDANDNQFTKVDWPRVVSLRPQTEVELSNPIGNTNVTLRKRSMPKVSLKNVKTTLSSAYRLNADKITKSYSITFHYTADKLAQKKTKADKVWIAFYNSQTKRWQLVGRNTASKLQAKATLKNKGTFVLVALK